MRTRSTSPIQYYPQHAQPQIKKYYTRQEVSQILKAMMESKLSKIYQQLQQKQQLIKTLNDKLNRNDHQLQSSTQKIYQISQSVSRVSMDHMHNTVEITSNLINERLQSYWQTVQIQLDKIRNQCQNGINKFHQGLQEKVNRVLGEIKQNCQQNVQNFKKKSNAYWIKVKQALNKINNKTVQLEQKVTAIGLQISKYESQRQEHYKAIKQIQNAPNTAKMLLQLKKSVNNVYKNFEEVLKIQLKVKENYEKMGSIDKLYCQKCSYGKHESSPSKNSWNYNKNFSNKPSPSNKQQDIVILQYSMQQDTLSNHQIQNSQDHAIRQAGQSIALIKNQVKKQLNHQVFPLSPITGKVIQTSSLSNTQLLLGSDKFKNTHQTANTNASMKNQTLQWGDHDDYMNINNYQQKNDNSGSFQYVHNMNLGGFQASNNSNSRMMIISNPNNVTSTSLLNFSLDCRKQMLESVRQRLLQMIQTKAMNKPIKVYLDQINYLKNQQGNYLFDLKGNMFKLTPAEFHELEKQKIIWNIKLKDQAKKQRKFSEYLNTK